MKTQNAQKMISVLTAVSLAFLQAAPAGFALPSAPRDQNAGTGVSVPVQAVTNTPSQLAQAPAVIPSNSLMNTGGIRPIDAIKLPPYPPAVQSYVTALQSRVGGGFKVTATRQRDGTYLISVTDSKVYIKVPTAGLHQMSFVLDAKLQVKKDSLKASYYGTNGDVKVDAKLLFEAVGACPQGEMCTKQLITDTEKLTRMTRVVVFSVDASRAIYFLLDQNYYKASRDARGNVKLERELPPAVQAYVSALQARVGDGFKVTAIRQNDGTYLVSVADSKVYIKAPTAGLHQMSFILDAKLQVKKDSLQASYYGPKGDIKVDAKLLFDAMGACPQGEMCTKQLISDTEKLTRMTRLTVFSVDTNGAIHFMKDGKYYKTYRDANGAPVVQPEPPPYNILPADIYMAAAVNLVNDVRIQLDMAMQDFGPNSQVIKQVSDDGKETVWQWTSNSDPATKYLLIRDIANGSEKWNLIRQTIIVPPYNILPSDVYISAAVNLVNDVRVQLDMAMQDIASGTQYSLQMGVDGSKSWRWTSANGKTTYALSKGMIHVQQADGTFQSLVKWSFSVQTAITADNVAAQGELLVADQRQQLIDSLSQAIAQGAVITKAVSGGDIGYSWKDPQDPTATFHIDIEKGQVHYSKQLQLTPNALAPYGQNLTDQAQRDQFNAAMLDVGPNSTYTKQVSLDGRNTSWSWTSADGKTTYTLSQNKDMVVPTGINGEMREEIRWSFDAKTQVSKTDIEQYAGQLPADSRTNFLEALAQTDPTTIFTKTVNGNDVSYSWGGTYQSFPATYVIDIQPDGRLSFSIRSQVVKILISRIELIQAINQTMSGEQRDAALAAVNNAPEGTKFYKIQVGNNDPVYQWNTPVTVLAQYANNLTDSAQKVQFEAALYDIGPDTQYSMNVYESGAQSWNWTSADGKTTYKLIKSVVKEMQNDQTVLDVAKWSFQSEVQVSRAEVEAYAAQLPDDQKMDFEALIGRPDAIFTKVTQGNNVEYNWVISMANVATAAGQTIARLRIDHVRFATGDGTFSEETMANFVVESPTTKEEIIAAAGILIKDPDAKAQFEAAIAAITASTVFTKIVSGASVSYSWREPDLVKLQTIYVYNGEATMTTEIRVSPSSIMFGRILI